MGGVFSWINMFMVYKLKDCRNRVFFEVFVWVFLVIKFFLLGSIRLFMNFVSGFMFFILKFI